MQLQRLNRTAGDVGNLVNFGHVNVTIPDQSLSTTFHVTGLGLTRDPYLMTGTDNMWINIGCSQFHLPTDALAQRVRGRTALVVPDLDALVARLERVRDDLAGTQFAFSVEPDVVRTTSPWGNRIDCYAPDPERFGPVSLGIAFVEFAVPVRAADGIARFYHEVFDAIVGLDGDADARRARVTTGHQQYLVFRETSERLDAYDGHHIQIYVTEFSRPYDWLADRELITSEDGTYQYRFREIVDPSDGRPLYTLEHEVRSISHPMYGRDLVNRDPAVHVGAYAPGREVLRWASRG